MTIAPSDLINKGKSRRALRVLNGRRERDGQANTVNSAEFYHQRALAGSLSGRSPRDFFLNWALARQCSDYTSNIEGDFLRDFALDEVRHRRFIHAQQLFKVMQQFHEKDQNRAAVHWMVHGRIMYGRGRYGVAIKDYSYALELWSDLGERANSDWIRNTEFAKLRALAALPTPDKRRKELPELANVIIHGDPSRFKRLRARVIRTGWLGAWVERLAARIMHA